MAKRYTRVNWQNAPSTATPVNAENLNTMDKGIADAHSQLAEKANELLQTQNRLKPKTVKPIISFSFDDGTIYDLDIATLFNSKGIVGITGIIYDKIGTTNYMTKSQIESLQTLGWEIASHSKTHSVGDFTTLTQEQLEIEFRESKKLLNSLGFNVRNLLLPFGFTNDNIAKTAAKYYRSMRVSGNGITATLNPVPLNTFRLNSLQLGDSLGTDASKLDSAGNVQDSLEQWKYWVDRAIEYNKWLIFISHSNNVVKNYDRMDDLSALIDYIQSLDVDIVTIDEALNTFENQVDTDKFKIGFDGTPSGQYAKTRYAPADTILATTPFSDIEVQQTTVNIVTAGRSENFPSSTGGTLVTIKPDNVSTRAFQLAKGTNNQTLWSRGFDATGVAGEWEKLTDSVVTLRYDSRNALSPLSDFPFGISFVQVTQGNREGMPTPHGYLLETKRPSTGSGFNVQLAHIYNGTATYKRTWKSTGEWTAWSQLCT